jgi:hypothetical protein
MRNIFSLSFMKPRSAIAIAAFSLLATLAGVMWSPGNTASAVEAIEIARDPRALQQLEKQFKLVRPLADAKAVVVDTRIQPGNGADTVELLARSYPAAARDDVKRTFTQLLGLYPQVETRHNIPHNDMAGALAIFIAGAYSGYSGKEVGDDEFKALVRQMRPAIGAKTEFAAASMRDKQSAFEQLAILGMFMAGTHEALATKPDAPDVERARENLRRAAKAYLEQLLGVDADSVRISTQGLFTVSGAAKSRTVIGDAMPTVRAGPGAMPARGNAIEAVVLNANFGMGYNGMVTLKYDPVVLFKDGGFTRDTDRALQDQPRIDGRWRRAGNGWSLVANDGKVKNVEAKMRARPAPAGATLEGQYRSMSGVGNAQMNVPVVAAWKNLQFSRDGTVRTAQGAGADAGNVVTSSRQAATKRYRLQDYTITFTDPDGGSETKLFYFFPDSDRSIGLGGDTLSRRS